MSKQTANPAPDFSSLPPEESLDPHTPEEWGELRQLGHRMLDDMIDFLAGVRDRPVWQSVPEAVRATFRSPLPLQPAPAAAVYEEFKTNILPYPTGNIHPRFWGWVMGTGSPLGMLADMLASGMNPHVAGYDQSAAFVEHQVLQWFTEVFGFPKGSSGVLTSGGTVANLLGVTVARNARAGFDVRAAGLQKHDGAHLTMYCSTETHSWAQKAVELLGLGDAALRRIAVGADFKMDVQALAAAIDADTAAGLRPVCVIGTAGTVNTGATDDLAGLARLCRERGLWFHVDGAFGAFAKVVPSHAHLVDGIEQADSIAFDLHKWMYMPIEAGCVLVRSVADHRQAFAVSPSYLTALERGIAVQPLEFAARGIDLTRSFKALKVWFLLKTHGMAQFARLIEQNITQARYLVERIREQPELELLAPVELNVVCFRYRSCDAVNKEILMRLQESGEAMPSGTLVHGHFAIRVAITNHRSRREDFDLLTQLVVKEGRALSPLS